MTSQHQTYDMNNDNDRQASGMDLLTRIRANGANHRIVLTNACWLAGTGFLRNNGDPQCPVPAGAHTEFANAHALIDVIQADGRKTLTFITSKVRKESVNPIVRAQFGTKWHEAENRNLMQEWALRMALCGGVPAPAPVAAPVAAPAPETATLADLLASMSKTEAPAPAAAPAPASKGLPEMFADILAAAEAEKAPVAQATVAQPVASVDKEALVAMAVAQHGMPKSSAQRMTSAVLESILGL